jgi:hypothetical protein
MNNLINSKKYQNFPITSFITGIVSLTVFSLKALKMLFSSYLNTDITSKIFSTIIVSVLGLALPVVAIVCGSIDLLRIKKRLHSIAHFKAFDITGIILGSIVFLIVVIFNFGPMILHN